MPSGVKGSRVVLPGNRAMMREYAVINLLDFARKVVAETM